MKKYTDGFVIPVPKKKLNAYRAMAQKAATIWKEFGALDYKECALDDSSSQFGLSFTKGIAAKRNETVIFSWIVYKSRKDRDAVNKRVMTDPRISDMCKEGKMPFDATRMIHGGVKVIVDGFDI